MKPGIISIAYIIDKYIFLTIYILVYSLTVILIYKEPFKREGWKTTNLTEKWAKDNHIVHKSQCTHSPFRHMKRYSTLLWIREIEIKTTPRCHLLPFILREVLDLDNTLLGKLQWGATCLAPPKGNPLQSTWSWMLQSPSQWCTLKTHLHKYETTYEQTSTAALFLEAKYWKELKYHSWETR